MLASSFVARLDEALDDRGFGTGAGLVSRLGTVQEQTFGVFFDFSNFPVSVDVQVFSALSHSATDVLFISTHLTLTDLDSPPQGNSYRLSGTYAIQGGSGAFFNANGTGTISGTCTSSFTSDVARCSEQWRGSFAQ